VQAHEVTLAFTKKQQAFVILATISGGAIEWYELFLYIYWAPILSKLFFSADSDSVSLIKTLFIFFMGFLARPIGGLIFGHVGDKYGRRVSFIQSIILMCIPSFAMGLVPSIQMGIIAPILLCILRFLQGLPAGGELAGAMCYLAECAPPGRRSFICSFSFVGPQIGVIISMLECYFFEKYMSHEFLISWGWRISFIAGGFLGLLGFYLRSKLKESPEFERLEHKKRVFHAPIIESVLRHKKELIFAFFASFLDVIGFYMFTVFLGIYLSRFFKISQSANLLIIVGSMVLSTITLPLIGKLGDRYNIKRLLTGSTIGMILFSYPLYLAAARNNLFFTIVFELALLLILNMQAALLPCLIAELFPTSTRYTGIGMSFNLCDSVIGGLTPVLALLLANQIGGLAAFLTLIIFASLVSLIAFLVVKEQNLRRHFSRQA
jgi:MHS family proline/betaine transporter-like MFS transporter